VKIEQSSLARRRFLCGMIGGGAVALGAGAVGPLVEYAGDFHRALPPDFITLDAAAAQLEPGTAKMAPYGDIPLLLLRPAEGGPLRIFAAVCTHLNCTVSYQAAENRIFCACHNGVYDTDGRVVSGPPPAPLRKFYSKLSHGKLIIAMDKENLEKANQEKANLEKAS
jgi:Rieske Fe-S protein